MTLSEFLYEISAVIVDNSYVCFPAESDEGYLEISADWENGAEVHQFDEESFENAVIEKNSIKLKCVSGEDFVLTPLTEYIK